MRFHELNKAIPKGVKGEKHEHTLPLDNGPGWGVRVRYPGKYGPDDYVVEVTDITAGWKNKQVQHSHLFYDMEAKYAHNPDYVADAVVPRLLGIIRGDLVPSTDEFDETLPGVQSPALELSTQALAVCEYRRLPSGDRKGGGRYLPINFILGIILGKWTAGEASAKMRYGRPVVERLGFPLFNSTNVDVTKYVEEVFDD